MHTHGQLKIPHIVNLQQNFPLLPCLVIFFLHNPVAITFISGADFSFNYFSFLFNANFWVKMVLLF